MFGFIGRRVKKAGNTASRWAGMPLIKRLFAMIKGIFSNVFKREQGPQETFEEAVARLQLTPATLEERKKIFKIQLIVYSLALIPMGAYTLYLLVHGYWLSIIISSLMVVFLIVSALRCHFWIFQIQQQKLGCTMKEWLNASIKESK